MVGGSARSLNQDETGASSSRRIWPVSPRLQRRESLISGSSRSTPTTLAPYLGMQLNCLCLLKSQHKTRNSRHWPAKLASLTRTPSAHGVVKRNYRHPCNLRSSSELRARQIPPRMIAQRPHESNYPVESIRQDLVGAPQEHTGDRLPR